jgi:prepilin-type N-terminal cleavage/methylation domain-containing protein
MDGRGIDVQAAEQSQQSRAGMTLTEVMVSMLVFTVAATAVYGLALSLLRFHDSTNRTAEATRVAENRIEELISMDYGSLTNLTNVVSGYSVVDTVTAVSGQKNVRVEVSWADISGNPRNVEVWTMLTE